MKMLLVTVGLLLLMSYATIYKGSTEFVDIDTSVDDVKVYLSGQYLGETPLSTKLESKTVHTLTFKKEGYCEASFQLTNRVGVGWVVLDVLGGLIPAIVDAVTGNWFELSTTQVYVEMEPV